MTSIADASQRRAAIDPTRSFIVQAPAGSGKTELLIQRILALLGSVRRPEEILAITFTRKAAAEMRSRLLMTLEGADGPKPPSEHGAITWTLARAVRHLDRNLGWDLLENPSRLAIQTIDSFNASLVRRMPWLSRFGDLPKVAEDPFPLYREASERTLYRIRDGGKDGGSVALLLAHLDNRLDLLRNLVERMLARRDQWLRHLVGKRGIEQRQMLEKALQSVVEEHLLMTFKALPARIRDDLCRIVPFAADNLRQQGISGPISGLADLRGIPSPCAEDLPLWQGLAGLLLTGGGVLRRAVNKACGFPADRTEICLTMKRDMEEVLNFLRRDEDLEELISGIRELPPVVYPDDQWDILQALVDLLPLAVAELWLVFREKGITDFPEIALKALQALQENESPSELLLQLDTRIRHILVDEFQDTSHLQFELLRQLTAGWLPGDGRTLFLVGDPMQSIYRFREAEVGLFLQARNHGVGDINLEQLSLSSNFRSQAGIVNWVNRSFPGIFPGHEDEARGAVPFAEATFVHPELSGPAVSVHPFAKREDWCEAATVVDLVRRGREDSENQTVAVLVRSRSHIGLILRAFREAGLRYQAQDIDLLADRPAARDIVSLTRALLHPADHLAWLAVLRAPWCGMLLADLHALCGTPRMATVPTLLADQGVLARLSTDGRNRATRVFATLTRAIDQRGRVGLRRLVEGCWLALGGPACFDSAAQEDAERVFTLMESLDRGGDLEFLEALEEGLQKLFAAPDPGADGRLQVMTMHKAKGLEFDMVILPGLGRPPARGEPPLLRWLEQPESGLLLAPIAPRGGSSRDPIYDAIARIEQEKEDHEALRLLYVAVTRAKRRLHLVGHAPPGKNGENRPLAGSLLQKLWPVVATEFTRLAATEEAEPAPASARTGNRLQRLPADWVFPELVPAPVNLSASVGRPSSLGERDASRSFSGGWAAATARHVGTVTHKFLELFAREGVDRWPRERLTSLNIPIGRMLGRLGTAAAEIPQGTEKVLRALINALVSSKGRWVLTGGKEAACELGLSGLVNGRLVHAVIDRTFVDEEGIRWVIDYKTSEPQQEDLPVFLAREQNLYQEQLRSYAVLLGNLDKERKLRAGLYFPMVDCWCEVPLGEKGRK